MAVITIVVLAQKVLSARAAIDVPSAPEIAGLGILISLVACRARAAGHGQYLCAQIIQFGARSGVVQRDHNALHNNQADLARRPPTSPVPRRDLGFEPRAVPDRI